MDIFGFIDVPGYVIGSLAVLIGAYIYYTWHFGVLKSLGIPHPRPYPVIGTTYTLFKHGFQRVHNVLSAKYGKIYGTYDGRYPYIVVCDPDIIKEVMIKQFSIFTDRQVLALPQHPIVRLNILLLQGEHWKLVRSFLTPTFSSGKMRKMSPLIEYAADQMLDNLADHYKDKRDINLKELTGNFTMEVIASTAFGIQLNTQKEKNHPFILNAKNAVNLSTFSFTFLITFFCPFLLPILSRFTPKDQRWKSIDFFVKVVEEALKLRRSTIQERPDFLNLMVEAEQNFNKASEATNGATKSDQQVYNKSRGLTNAEIIAQAIVFMVAGYETTSTTLSFLIYSLAIHPQYQEKVIQEIDNVFKDGEEPNYDNVNKLPYLEQCIDETLRIYPPAVRLARTPSEEVVIKGQRFPKGIPIVTPVNVLHRDPEVWPDPEKFDPDRFSPEAKAGRSPYNFMPFGLGPRNCVGMRLAQLEMKMLMVKIMRKYKFVQTKNTVIPLNMDMHAIIGRCKDDILLGLEER